MFKLIIAFLFPLVSAANEVGGMVFVNRDASEAFIIINEVSYNGTLKDLYKKMNLEVLNDRPSQGEYKTLTIADGRFSLQCSSAETTNGYDPTSCRFTIKNGQNSNDINTSIFKVGNEKFATIGLSSKLSKKLSKAFPWLKGSTQSYLITTDNNAIFEIKGSIEGNLTISFSSN